MPTSLPALDNLISVNELKAEARNEVEVRKILAMARTHLAGHPASLMPR